MHDEKICFPGTVDPRGQLEIRTIGTYPDDAVTGGAYIKSNIISLKNWRLTIQIRGIKGSSGSCTFVKYTPSTESPRDICWRRLFSSSLNRQP